LMMCQLSEREITDLTLEMVDTRQRVTLSKIIFDL
jgi:thymidine phosphorylase